MAWSTPSFELQNQREAADLTRAEWLALLLDRELATRSTKRYNMRLRSAKLRHGQVVIEDVDYRAPRQLDKALCQQLAGYLVRSLRRRAGTAIACSMPASPGCVLTWNAHAAMVALRACPYLGQGRFGGRIAHGQPTARFVGDRRRSLWSRLNAYLRR